MNTGDRDGVTALMNASEGGHEVCVNTLLQAGADVNKRSNNGFTAYKFAMKRNHQACMQRLLQADATFGAPDGLRFMAAWCKVLLRKLGLFALHYIRDYTGSAVICRIVAICLYVILSYGLI